MPARTVGESGNIEEVFGWGEGARPGAGFSAPGRAGGHQVGNALFEGIKALAEGVG